MKEKTPALFGLGRAFEQQITSYLHYLKFLRGITMHLKKIKKKIKDGIVGLLAMFTVASTVAMYNEYSKCTGK